MAIADSRGRGVVALLLLAGLALTAVGRSTADAGRQPTGDATALVETEPVLSTGDAADDPALWRDPADPGRSVVIGNDKGGALEVYDLDGRRLQRLTGGFYGNVDTRPGVPTGTGAVDLVAAYRLGVRVYAVDPATRTLTSITDGDTGSIATPITGEGLCLYRSPAGDTFVFVNDRSGVMVQLRLADADLDGLLEGEVVRRWDVGGEVEGCVADDEGRLLYVSEEDVGIWRYGAEPTDSTLPADRGQVDTVVARGGRIRPDAEGLTIVYQPDGRGYLIASSQAASDSLNSYLVYDRAPGNAFVREFRVVDGEAADGCGRTDGIDALAADLGPRFPHGVFVCQDNANTTPAPGNQNFKLVPLEQVVALDGVPLPPASPVAVLDASCTGLDCTFTGERSSDADGTVAAYSWDFGDGTTSTEPAPRHAYAGPGWYTVTLSVVDDTGRTGTATTRLGVTEPAPPVSFVARALANASTATHRVTVPAAVRPGDGLLLLMGVSSTATIGDPAGWRRLGVVTGAGVRSAVWTRVATAADASARVTVRTSTTTKGHLVVLAYRNTASPSPVGSFAAAPDTGRTTAHTTPSVAVPPGGWAVWYWTHKDNTTRLLTAPSGVTVRAAGTQSGSGNVKALVADSGGPVASSPVGGLTATAGSASLGATMWAIALPPARP